MEGVCRYMHETLSRMVRNHPEHEFVFFFDRSYSEEFVYADNVTPVKVSPPTRHPILWYVWFEWQIPRLLKKYKIDVFYSPDTYNSLQTKVPSLIVSHDIAYAHYPEHIPQKTLSYYKKFFPKFHQHAKAIVAVSESTKQDIIKEYGLEANKIVVGYNACPSDVIPFDESQKKEIRERLTQGRPYFIYVGSIHPRKNVHRLLLAFEKFKEQGNEEYKLLIVGRMAWKTDEFKKILVGMNSRKDVEILSGERQNLLEALAASEGLVYVSLFEGFGIPILEAMKLDVPVISSNCSSMPEAAGQAAILIDPNNVEAISEAMTAFTDTKLREKYIQKGREQLLKFDWEKTAEINFQAIIRSSGS